MDWLEKRQTITAYFRKYRWAALVLLVGLILMMFPEKTDDADYPVDKTLKIQESSTSLQQELEDLLSELAGAGKVKVLLSPASGSRTYYQTDEDQSKSMDTLDKQSKTVIITSSDRSQTGLIQRIDPPVYLGAVVLCQGGNSPSIRLAIVEAVATATGLTSDKISVLTMK